MRDAVSHADEVRLICWPYQDGRRDFGMGLGPSTLAADDRFLAAFADAGVRVVRDAVPPVDEARPEIARVIELDRRLAACVRVARNDGAFPLVLAGACNSCLGTVAGLSAGQLGVVWFDAHADFDTPEDNTSGFFDVMGLAMLTGAGWAGLRGSIPGLEVIDEQDVAVVAVRDLESYQRARLGESQLHWVAGAIDAAELKTAFDAMTRRVDEVYLHIDLDALDTTVGRANEYAAPGGPTAAVLAQALDEVFDRFFVQAAALTAYDPRLDGDGHVADAARLFARTIARRLAKQASSRSRSSERPSS